VPAGPQPVDKVLLDRLSGLICQLGLQAPALLVLDAGRPLGLILAQLLYVVEPTADILFADNAVGKWANLLENPATLPTLVAQLEEMAEHGPG